MPPRYTLGIDLGGTTTTLGVIGPNAEVVWEQGFPTPREVGFDVFTARVAAAAETARAVFPFDAAGVAVAAQIDAARGVILTSPNLPWENVPVVAVFKAALGVPVVAENDVNAAAYGEYLADADRRDPFLVVFVGTGVGSGIIARGDLFRGADGFAAEIGHVPVVAAGGERCGCGRYGCLEAYAGGRGILRRASAEGATYDAVDDVVFAAAAGNDHCRQVLEDAASYLGVALAGAVNLLNPATVVIGGGVARAWPPLRELAAARMRVSALAVSLAKLRLRASTLGTQAGIVGVAALARRRADEAPAGHPAAFNGA